MAARNSIIKLAQRTIVPASWKRPMIAHEINVTGLQKIEFDNRTNPQGPFSDPFDGHCFGHEIPPSKGSGTKADPFIVPARNPARLVMEHGDYYGDDKPFHRWWVYATGDGISPDNMTRSPYTGRFYKLAYDPTDYYGVDQYDPHSHAYSQY